MSSSMLGEEITVGRRVLEQAQVSNDQIRREHFEPAEFVVFGTS